MKHTTKYCVICVGSDPKDLEEANEHLAEIQRNGEFLCFDCFCWDICGTITRNVFEGETFEKAFNREVPRALRKRVLAAYEFPLKKQIENAVFYLEDKFDDMLGDWEFRIK